MSRSTMICNAPKGHCIERFGLPKRGDRVPMIGGYVTIATTDGDFQTTILQAAPREPRPEDILVRPDALFDNVVRGPLIGVSSTKDGIRWQCVRGTWHKDCVVTEGGAMVDIEPPEGFWWKDIGCDGYGLDGDGNVCKIVDSPYLCLILGKPTTKEATLDDFGRRAIFEDGKGLFVSELTGVYRGKWLDEDGETWENCEVIV